MFILKGINKRCVFMFKPVFPILDDWGGVVVNGKGSPHKRQRQTKGDLNKTGE